jgi:hypothetical protein
MALKTNKDFIKAVPFVRRDGLVGNWKPSDLQPRIAAEQFPQKVEAARERYFIQDVLPFDNARLNIGSATKQFVRIYLVNSPVVSSDARTKEDVTNNAYGLKEILDIKTKKYKQTKTKGDKKNKDTYSLGVLAQDLMDVVPECVVHDERSDVYGVQYDQLIPILINAVQELSKEVDKLKKGGK